EFELRELSTQDDKALSLLGSRHEVGEFIGAISRGDAAGVLRAIVVDTEVVGLVGLVPSGAFNGTDVELICALLSCAEGRGLAGAACRRLLSDASIVSGRARILACVADKNKPARRLASRLGFAPLKGDPRRVSGEAILELVTLAAG